MSEKQELRPPLKSFYGTTIRKNAEYGASELPIQVLGLSPANQDNSDPNRPCSTFHVFNGDVSCFLFDFPISFNQNVITNTFYLKGKNLQSPPYPNAQIDYNLISTNGIGMPYAKHYYHFGAFGYYTRRSGVCIDWSAVFAQYGWGEFYFYIKNTPIRSQTYILHDDSDLYHKQSSITIKTVSNSTYRNYRYQTGGVEPLMFDLTKMFWTDYLRVPAHILPTPANIEKTIVQYSSYGQDIQQSNDQNTFDFIFKGLWATYIIRRFEFYALNSALYLTDDNKQGFDKCENRRCLYNGSHDFGIAKGNPYLTNPTFSLKNYNAMGANNRVMII